MSKVYKICNDHNKTYLKLVCNNEACRICARLCKAKINSLIDMVYKAQIGFKCT